MADISNVQVGDINELHANLEVLSCKCYDQITKISVSNSSP